MNEEDSEIYAQQLSDDLDGAEFEDDYQITKSELNYDKWIREPSSKGIFEYLNKDIAGANLDSWEIAHINALYIYLKNLKALHNNGINTAEAQIRTIEKIMQKAVTSTGKEGFMQKIRVTKNIHRTGEYINEDKKAKAQFLPNMKRR